MNFLGILFVAHADAAMSTVASTASITTDHSSTPLGVTLVVIAIGLLPTIIAFARKHYNAIAITVVNILLGWTLIGWIIALVWAFGRTKKLSGPETLNGKLIGLGVNGQMYLTDDEVIITRKGMLGYLSQGLKGSKHIPISSVTSVQLKDVGGMTRGYIQLGVLGGRENVGGAFAAVTDENSVTFTSAQQETFRKIASGLRAQIAARGRPQVISTQSSAADLEGYARLLEKGLMTQEEFDSRKSKILNS